MLNAPSPFSSLSFRWPVRLLAPGHAGCRNVKWVGRIEVTERPSELDAGSRLGNYYRYTIWYKERKKRKKKRDKKLRVLKLNFIKYSYLTFSLLDRHFAPEVSWDAHRAHSALDRCPEDKKKSNMECKLRLDQVFCRRKNSFVEMLFIFLFKNIMMMILGTCYSNSSCSKHHLRPRREVSSCCQERNYCSSGEMLARIFYFFFLIRIIEEEEGREERPNFFFSRGLLGPEEVEEFVEV